MTGGEPETGRVLYIDPWTGVSGDMLLGAMLHADRENGDLERALRESLVAIGLDPAVVSVVPDVERGISCVRVRVEASACAPLRHLSHMESMLEGEGLSANVRERSRRALRRLAEVEAGIHGSTIEEVHFHEVGAVDALVDVVGAFTLVESLGVDSVFVGPIQVGGGTVEIAHGRMGVPAPATAVLLSGYATVGGPEPRELTTPTGALLVSELGALSRPLPPMTIRAVGYGAGTMRLESGPNVLRVLVGERGGSPDADGAASAGCGSRESTGGAGSDWSGSRDQVVQLECNVDDISPEVIGYACNMLREAGAFDVWVTGVQMKKGRPGMLVSLLCKPQQEDQLAGLLFRETGTLGVRRVEWTRRVADRGEISVVVWGMPVRVKWGRWGGAVTSLAAEYEDAADVARRCGRPLKDVTDAAEALAREAVEPAHLVP